MQRKNKLLTGNYEKEKTGLIRKIARLKDKQRAKYNQVKKLNSRYHNKKIHLGKFETKLKKLLEGYTLTSWFDDNAIRTRKLENELFVVNSKIKTSQNNNVYREITFVSLLILFTFAYFYLDPSIVGYGVLDSQYFINNTGFITLNKNVTSLRLSGYLEGNGTAKIYLEDYLVLDSTFLNQTVSQTGKNIVNNQSDSTNLFGIQPVNEILSTRIDFADICIETCNNISPSHLLKVEIEGSLIIQITRFDYNLERKILPEEETAEPVFGIPLENFTSNETVSSKRNITVENLTFENLTVTYRDESIQEKAEINKPVEWKLKTKNKSISLPSEAVNVEVYKEVFSLTSNSTKEKAKLKNVFGINSVSDKKLIEVDELNETQLEVTYFTKAPYSIESNFSEINNKIIKNITIKSDSEIHYSNVLSYTDISPEIQNINQVKLFHYVIKNISIGNETNGSDYETVKE
ncbi:hypothetical protein HYX16_05295, partial [Candidatus Woesearchaeota archaeon]|nr:hypothetical protein [Candidatus Woesearchaeota archaeon]